MGEWLHAASRWSPRLAGAFAVLLWTATAAFGEAPRPAAPAVPVDPAACATAAEAHGVVETPPAASPFTGDLFTRSAVTGDWGGARSGLADNGVGFRGSFTQFYQGVTSGGREREFQYGGKLDYFADIDGQKAGLWQGFFVNLHGETRFGESTNNIDGAVLPSNTALFFPQPNGTVTGLTAVKFTQALSENFVVFGGKINTIDEYKLAFTSGSGLTTFMNSGLVYNPIVLRQVPYSTVGAGAAVLMNKEPVASVMVLDTNNSSTTSGLDTLFDRGAVIVGEVRIPVSPLDLPGHQIFGGVYSSRKYTDLDPSSLVNVPGVGLTAQQKTGSWSLYWNFDQYLYVDPCNSKRGWGVFLQSGLADGNPSPTN
jgi:porin